MNHEKLKNKAEMLGVDIEVYTFLCRSDRKIRYFTYDPKAEKNVINHDSITIIPSREDSYDRLLESKSTGFATEERSVEETVIETILLQQLRSAIKQLSDRERRLIEELFFSHNGDGKSEREAAKSLGVPQKTLNDRKLRILKKLRKMIELQK